jgi:hypothetical protein
VLLSKLVQFVVFPASGIVFNDAAGRTAADRNVSGRFEPMLPTLPSRLRTGHNDDDHRRTAWNAIANSRGGRLIIIGIT